MNHPKHERTLVVLKPDAVQRSLIGEIIKRFERVGLKLVALKRLSKRRFYREALHLRSFVEAKRREKRVSRDSLIRV